MTVGAGNMPDLKNVRGVLIDLDGVLYVGTKVIEGAMEAVSEIRARGLACRFITNSSTLSLASLQNKLQKLGLQVAREEIFSAPQAALTHVRQHGNGRCRLLLAEDVMQDFAAIVQSDEAPDYVVIGDIGDAWSYALLNDTFRCLMQGAQLIAIHKNKFWQTEQGLQMDIGGFISALEYASGVQATIIGKPSVDFFQAALQDMRLPASQVVVIGDDIDSDVGGGQQAGLRGVLVRTGKYRQAYAEKSPVKPDLVLESIKDFPAVLGN